MTARTNPPSRLRGAKARGYTMVEVMMALAILAVGAVGVISLQKVAVMGGLNARNLTSASDVAAGWIEVMQGEATSWNSDTNSDLTNDPVNMPLIKAALAGGDSWVDIPVNSGTYPAPNYPRGGGTTLDGRTFACHGACTGSIAYCSIVRARVLGPANGTGAGDTIRVEVLTFFARNGRPIDDECNPAIVGAAGFKTAISSLTGTVNIGAVQNSRYEYGYVVVAGTIRRNTL